MSAELSQEDERSNLRTFFRLVTSIEASDGKLNLLLAVCDRAVERDAWIRKYETELQDKALRCYRVQLAQQSPSLKQSLLDLQERGGTLGAGAIVSVVGAAELLDLRLGEPRSALEKLLFSLQWTREGLRTFECPIVLWVSNQVVNGIATASPDFWSWRGSSVFEFVSQSSNHNTDLVDYRNVMAGEIAIVKPNVLDMTSELGIKAAAQWEELETLLASDPDSPLLARLYQNIGFTERNRGNWDSAETVIKRAIQLHQKDNNRSSEALCIGVLGDIERKRGNWDAAERLYRQCLQVEEELGDRSGMATSWGQLGNIERNRGNWDAAERLFRQSLQVYEELGDRSGMATSWGVLGDIERNRGNWDAAERLFRQSLQMYEELGDRSGMATSIGCLGENELGRGNLDKAETLLKDALLQMQQLGMTDSIAETNWDLAQLYHAKNNPELAQQHYTIAHQLYAQLGAAKDIEKLEAWRTEDGRERTEEVMH